MIQSIPQAISSLEKDIFPGWVGCGLSGYMSLGRFIDIGIPEDFAAVENFFAGMNSTDTWCSTAMARLSKSASTFQVPIKLRYFPALERRFATCGKWDSD
jgi:hypothetical protein